MKSRTLSIVLILALFVLLPCTAFAQLAALPAQSCVQGGVQASTSGMNSTNYLQGVIPSCTVTVYLTGTTTLATIYAGNISTPLANPFTASTAGQFIAYASVNQGYDVVLSGGIAPNTYLSPVTLTGLYPGTNIVVTLNLASPGPIGGTTPSTVNATTLTAQSLNGAINPLLYAGSDLAAKTATAVAAVGCSSTVPCNFILPPSPQLSFSGTLTLTDAMTFSCTPAGESARQSAAQPPTLNYTGSGTAVVINGARAQFNGCGLAMGNATTGILIENQNAQINNVYTIGGNVGSVLVELGVSDNAQINQFTAFEFQGDGIWSHDNYDSTITNSLMYGYTIGGASGATNHTSRSLVIDSGTGGIHIKNFGGGNSGLHGIVVQDLHNPGHPPAQIFASDVISDCSYGDGLLFDSSLGVYPIVAEFDESWISAAGDSCNGTSIRGLTTANDVHISGGKGIHFIGGWFRSAANNPFLIDNSNAGDISISNAFLYGSNCFNNNTPSTVAGVNVTANIDGLLVDGNTDGFAEHCGHQGWGVLIGPGLTSMNNVRIVNNDFYGNSVGTISAPAGFPMIQSGNINSTVFGTNTLFGGGPLGVWANYNRTNTWLSPFNVISGIGGLSVNGYFDGTNFIFPSDGGSNGGTLIGMNYGVSPSFTFYCVPNSGSPTVTQTIAPGSMSANTCGSLSSAGYGNGNGLLLPSTLTGYHGNASGVKVQLSDGTGTSVPAAFDANGNLTAGTSISLASPGPIGGTTPSTVNATTVTATSFVGPLTGNAATATTAANLSGSPSISVTNITASGIVAAVGDNPAVIVTNYTSTTGNSPNLTFQDARGAVGSPSTPLSVDPLGQFTATGWNGSAFPGSKGKIAFVATENWGPTANGTSIEFSTTANATTSRLRRFVIDQDGSLYNNASTFIVDPSGNLTVASCTGCGGGGGLSGMTTGQLPIAASASTVTSSIAYATAATASTIVERDSSNNINATTFNTAPVSWFGTGNANIGGSLPSASTGTYNTASGSGSLHADTTGSSNTANGYHALYTNTGGSSNTANGYGAGQFITGGSVGLTNPTNSIFIGEATQAKADNGTNEIVIGAGAVGNGSNTATIGNTSTTNVYMGTTQLCQSTGTGCPTSMNYDVHGGFSGTGTTSQYVIQELPSSSVLVTYPYSCTGSRAESIAAATASTIYTIYGCTGAGFTTCASVGTAVFAVSGKSASFTCTYGFTVGSGGTYTSLYMQGPVTPDTTLTNVAFTLHGTHN
jgi:hypothetical protein